MTVTDSYLYEEELAAATYELQEQFGVVDAQLADNLSRVWNLVYRPGLLLSVMTAGWLFGRWIGSSQIAASTAAASYLNRLGADLTSADAATFDLIGTLANGASVASMGVASMRQYAGLLASMAPDAALLREIVDTAGAVDRVSRGLSLANQERVFAELVAGAPRTALQYVPAGRLRQLLGLASEGDYVLSLRNLDLATVSRATLVTLNKIRSTELFRVGNAYVTARSVQKSLTTRKFRLRTSFLPCEDCADIASQGYAFSAEERPQVRGIPAQRLVTKLGGLGVIHPHCRCVWQLEPIERKALRPLVPLSVMTANEASLALGQHPRVMLTLEQLLPGRPELPRQVLELMPGE